MAPMRKVHDRIVCNLEEAFSSSKLRQIDDELTDKRMYRVKGPSKGLVEYVAYSGTSTQLSGFNVTRGSLDCGAVSAGKLRDDLQERLWLVWDIFSVGIQQRLELRYHHVYAHLEL